MADGAVPRFWREIPQRYNLISNQCGSCKKIYFPPRESCPYCRRKSMGKMKELKLKGTGKILTYSIIHTAIVNAIGISIIVSPEMGIHILAEYLLYLSRR